MLTVSRAMAEETIDAAIKEFNLRPTGPSQTDHIKLLGGHAWSKTMYIKLIQQFGLETEVAKHLSESYGDRAWTVASMASPTGTFPSQPMPAFCLSRIETLTDSQVYPGHCTVSASRHCTLTSRVKRVMPSDPSMPSPLLTSLPVGPGCLS